MIKTIIFDWGGVCTKGHLIKDFSKNLSLSCGYDEKTIEKTFRELEYSYEIGKISPKEFWSQFKENLHLKLSVVKLQTIFHNSYNINKEVLNLILKLKRKYTTILLTNNYEDLFSHIKRKYNLDKYFDFMISSSDIHYKKPFREIYQYIVDKLNIRPEESIIIDDKEKNLLVPRKMGFKTIVFKDVSQLKEDLSAILSDKNL